MEFEKFLLIRSEILELLDNTLTANYEYCRSNRQNLPLPIQIKLSEKNNVSFAYFFCIFGTYIKFPMFSKKWASEVKYFWSYWLRRMCLFKCITGLVSENRLTMNVLTSPKNSWNMQKKTFTLFFIMLSQNELEKVIFNHMLDFRTAC